MTDILLDNEGDIFITDEGDIRITESILQAARTRLLWLLGEWRFHPEAGMPYIEEFYVKNPSLTVLRRIIYEQLSVIDGVTDVRDVQININSPKRTSSITLKIVTDEKTFSMEVMSNA